MINDNRKTVVLGASPSEIKYSFQAVQMLIHKGYDVVPVGIREGKIMDIDILDLKIKPVIANVDTVSLYINPLKQSKWYDYIIGLNPRRIIFNPGTENEELIRLAKKNGIEALEACTLVMLSIGNY